MASTEEIAAPTPERWWQAMLTASPVEDGA